MNLEMLYLPSGIRRWFEQQAIEHNMNLGSYLIRILCERAIAEGFNCTHPSAFQVLYKKVDGRNPAQWRCKNCGEVYIKK